jgi:hypothetical protein
MAVAGALFDSKMNCQVTFEREEDNHLSKRALWFLLVGIFLMSFSLLAFEITLTRVLSVMLSYHYVFIVISLALLGLGVGGIYIHLFRRRIPRGPGRFGSLALFASLFSLSIPLSVIVMTRIATSSILLYCLLLFIPFFFAGALLAEVFRMLPALSSRIYGMDLVGAATGSIGVVLTLNSLGGINSSFFLALTASIAALLIATMVRGKNAKGVIISTLSFVIVLGLLGSSLFGSRLADIPVGTNQAKEIHQVLNEPSLQGEIIETRWSAFGRTDLVAYRNDPEQMDIFIDGTAGTPMYRFNGDADNPDSRVQSLKTSFPGYLPFLHLQEEERNNALIIGPGGGRDILLALLGGVGEITAVEVNRELVDIVREYTSYNGGIYTDFENVSLYVDEGRNFLKRQNEKYDIIMLSLPVTNTSRSLEGYALTENFIFTTDSINDYLEHLTDEGRLIVVAHDKVETLRLLSISLAALSQRGVDSEAAMEQIYIIGSGSYPVFVLKKTPFESAEIAPIHQSIHQLRYDPSSSYLPGTGPGSTNYHVEEGHFNELSTLNLSLRGINRGEIGFSDLERALEEGNLDVSPVTDDSPFFYGFEKGIPQSVSLVLWASVIMLSLVIVVPLVYWKKRAYYREARPGHRRGLNKAPLRFAVFFTMLGIGFMLVEISAIQRFILFLGQPVLSLAVLLFSLLVGAGTGSLYSGRFASEKIVKVIAVIAMSIVALLLVYAFSLPFILGQLLGLELSIRLLATVALLTPLGFLMGFPFPLGLRLLKEVRMENYIPWMWGINGIGSVLGSAMTIIVAISFGFTEALLLGAACYFIIFLTFQRIQPLRAFQFGGVPR